MKKVLVYNCDMESAAPDRFPIDPSTQTAIVRQLCEKLRAGYVFPEVAEEICSRLEKRLADGEYRDLAEGEFFALALTEHLQEVNHDRHLWVRWTPEPLPETAGPLSDDPAWEAQRGVQARLDNYGFHKVERLPGNVGYLEIRNFHSVEVGRNTAEAAMNFVAACEALLIDLRRCPGGGPDMIALVSSYLFDVPPVHLNSIYWRDEDVTEQFWTLADVPGQRFVDKPVYVLTSKETFSGAEEFAYNLQALRRAVLVGETTGGGAHPGTFIRLHPHFEAFIPVGRAINPLTGTNWEVTGVIPDISVPAGQAFTVAYRMALEGILAGLGQEVSGPYKALAEEIRAALE